MQFYLQKFCFATEVFEGYPLLHSCFLSSTLAIVTGTANVVQKAQTTKKSFYLTLKMHHDPVSQKPVTPILGAHMSIAGGFSQAARKTGEVYGVNAMQIFTKSPRGGAVKPLDPDDGAQFKELCQIHKIEHVFAHSSYLLNFAKSIEKFPWMKENILLDFQRLHLLGGRGVVVHIGKALETEREEALAIIVENAKKIIDLTHEHPLWYILENTAGQGSEIGYELEELSKIWKGLEGFSPRIKTCLDTAHIWAAGYEIGTKSGAEKVWNLYDQTIGIKNLACLHFNDSKKECKSHLDRHENIGRGMIGIEGLSTLARLASAKHIPLILETPDEEDRGKTTKGQKKQASTRKSTPHQASLLELNNNPADLDHSKLLPDTTIPVPSAGNHANDLKIVKGFF